MSEKPTVGEAFTAFVEVIKALRTPVTGCPWDLEQDHTSLRPYMLEEAYEALQAIDSKDDERLCDELGDVLLQVVLHAQVAADRNAFTITDIIDNVREKMVRRHPHVFGSTVVAGAEDVLKNWEQIKAEEGKAKRSLGESLGQIPEQLPSLLRAQRIGEKAAKVHFDWSSIAKVLEKVKEELGELEEVIAGAEELAAEDISPMHANRVLDDKVKAQVQHELGDLLFATAQLARWLGASAEDSLRVAASRFVKRFQTMEQLSTTSLHEVGEAELEVLWQRAKQQLREY